MDAASNFLSASKFSFLLLMSECNANTERIMEAKYTVNSMSFVLYKKLFVICSKVRFGDKLKIS